jgi:hypothetical protein
LELWAKGQAAARRTRKCPPTWEITVAVMRTTRETVFNEPHKRCPMRRSSDLNLIEAALCIPSYLQYAIAYGKPLFV